MTVPRRGVLALLAVSMTGCSFTPRVEGGPATPPSSPAPTQSEQRAQAIIRLAGLRRVVASNGEAAWQAAATAQLDAILAQLNTPDPLADHPQEQFEVTPGRDMPLAEAAAAAIVALRTAAAAETEPAARLAFMSAATAAAGLTSVAAPPTANGQKPRRLAALAVESSLPVALAHSWALVYGLGLAVGRLTAQEPVHTYLVSRLTAARQLRSELRAAQGDAVPTQPPAFALPTTMTTPDTIRAGIAQLELNLLGGYARLVAATDDELWQERMVAQAAPVLDVGGALPYWPGWFPG